MKTAAAYIRVSTDDQLELSPDSQRAEILAYAEKNDIILPEEFIFVEGEKKKGLSGRKAANRPKFQEMIALAKENPRPFDCILLWKFSRFARNIDEATYYKSILRNKCGIDVISISEPIMEGMYGRLIEMIIEWSDEFYSFNLATEVKRGMSARAKAGEHSSYAPMGYAMKNKRLVVDEQTAPVVRRVFEEYAAGEKVRTIILELNEQGVRTRYGNLIDHRFITYMISNPIYKGEVVFSTDGKRGRGGGADGERIIRTVGVHEPLVSEELWQRANARYERERAAARRESKKNDYALRSLVRCGSCGTSLSYATAGRLQCCAYSRGTCRVSHSIDCDSAEREVVARIRADLVNGTFAREAKKPVKADTAPLIKSVEKRLARLDEAYLAGAYALDEYTAMRARLTASIDGLRSEQRVAAEMAKDTPTLREISDVLEAYDTLPPHERNRILMTLLDKVVVHKTEDGFAFELFYR